jgi:hypothetical protein
VPHRYVILAGVTPSVISATLARNGAVRKASCRQRTRCRKSCSTSTHTEEGPLTLTHLPQSSSASRFTASQAGFFILSQSGERPEQKCLQCANPAPTPQATLPATGKCEARTCTSFPSTLRLERGSDQTAPPLVRELMALSRCMIQAPQADGRPSFWERPGRTLPDREKPAADDASRPRLLGGVNGW